jgi:hypothetical protein
VADIGEILSNIRPVERTVNIVLDGKVGAELDDARRVWVEARERDRRNSVLGGGEAPPLAQRVLDLEAEADASTVTFRIRAVSAMAWRRLIEAHPPITPAEREEGWNWHAETFAPAVIAASCIDPAMSVEQATELGDRLSDGQFSKLFALVLTVNSGDDLIPKSGIGTDETPSTESSSTTAPDGASPEASS